MRSYPKIEPSAEVSFCFGHNLGTIAGFKRNQAPTENPQVPDFINLTWCRGTESNCRHGDFQSPALPTELPRRKASASGFTAFRKVGFIPVSNHKSSNFLEAVSKLRLKPNLCAGPLNSILEIYLIFLRLSSTTRLDLEPNPQF